jgi:hypothetical protein
MRKAFIWQKPKQFLKLMSCVFMEASFILLIYFKKWAENNDTLAKIPNCTFFTFSLLDSVCFCVRDV